MRNKLIKLASITILMVLPPFIIIECLFLSLPERKNFQVVLFIISFGGSGNGKL